MFIPVPALIALAIIFVTIMFLLARRGSRGRDDLLRPPVQMSPKSRRTASPPILPPDIMKQVSDLLAGKQKIEAIKLVRETTGLGLKEAKDFVESL